MENNNVIIFLHCEVLSQQKMQSLIFLCTSIKTSNSWKMLLFSVDFGEITITQEDFARIPKVKES